MVTGGAAAVAVGVPLRVGDGAAGAGIAELDPEPLREALPLPEPVALSEAAPATIADALTRDALPVAVAAAVLLADALTDSDGDDEPEPLGDLLIEAVALLVDDAVDGGVVVADAVLTGVPLSVSDAALLDAVGGAPVADGEPEPEGGSPVAVGVPLLVGGPADEDAAGAAGFLVGDCESAAAPLALPDGELRCADTARGSARAG